MELTHLFFHKINVGYTSFLIEEVSEQTWFAFHSLWNIPFRERHAILETVDNFKDR